MKKISLSLVFSFMVFVLFAQDYTLSFVPTGAASSIHSISVLNYTQVTGTQLQYGDQLRLLGSLTNINEQSIDYELSIYPNPSTEETKVNYDCTNNGVCNISVIDLTGKKVVSFSKSIEVGTHELVVSGLRQGLYLLSIEQAGKQTTKKFYQSASKFSPSIRYLSSKRSNNRELKGKKSIIQMQYNPGDLMRFEVVYGNYRTIVMKTITASEILTVNLFECKDADNNHYPIVKIDNIFWMAENLKTTKLTTGSSLTSGQSVNNATWNAYTTGAYCTLLDDNNTNLNKFGRLYNFYAVSTGKICPSGWHVPSNTEWNNLITYAGGSSVAGGKLKMLGYVYWDSPNYGASNELGFGARAGGYRYNNGFYATSSVSFFWSSTQLDQTYSDAFYFSKDNTQSYQSSRQLYYGFSVRCLKD